MVKRSLLLSVAMLFAVINVNAFAQTWGSQTSGTANILEAVWFTDVQNGWAVGNSGTTLLTTNGGQSWSAISLTSEDLKDVAFFNQSLGLIVGDNGRIFRTTNGGTNWTQIASGTSSNILAVAFGEGGMAYAAGRDGIILRSADNGASWTVVETGTTRYRGIAAKGNQFAIVVGEGGKIKITADGGLNWVEKSSGTTSDLHDVFFLTTTEGWIAGQNEVLLYSNDGGNSWASRNTGITIGLEAVVFLNSNHGWAVGNSGAIFKTINGGQNWTPESGGVMHELNEVFFLNAANGWAVGDNGTILYRKDISVPSIILQLSSMNPHVGQKFEARVVDKATGFEASRRSLAAIPSPNFSVTFDNIESGHSYWIDFYADHNGNKVYDAPPVDHAWRLEANNVTGEQTVLFTHSTNFTDIQWPGTTGVDEERDLAEVPASFRLEQNYPNPFLRGAKSPALSGGNPETAIRFSLPQAAQVKLGVYNMLGQRVRVLVNGQLAVGHHVTRWDGKDDFGRAVSSGIYLYRLEAGPFVKTQRMIMIQ
ncbi:MAG: YCF48-related protein [candidate division KSB1 bacterium]|nr:YCF48-related protein [candidate division KSB1 bacterium]MDZ7305181.1 YCF48-related protein [candidate division KSB1 bacterium]MDZ7314269.1 YCF48-related protein [candidate division KSB1 bacterium]